MANKNGLTFVTCQCIILHDLNFIFGTQPDEYLNFVKKGICYGHKRFQ